MAVLKAAIKLEQNSYQNDQAFIFFMLIQKAQMTLSLRFLFISLSACLLISCTGTPDNIRPITHFSVDTYLGTWYELARLDHGFERGLEQVSANYSVREDGGIRVLNKGLNSEEQTWQQAEGKAFLMAEDNIGHLKVSFFGPFYGSYIIFELGHDDSLKLERQLADSNAAAATEQLSSDNQHAYAFVSGHNKKYLWLLARQPQVSDQLKEHFLEQAQLLGFAADELIWVKQSSP